jgi:hypothetical protein
VRREFAPQRGIECQVESPRLAAPSDREQRSLDRRAGDCVDDRHVSGRQQPALVHDEAVVAGTLPARTRDLGEIAPPARKVVERRC